MAKVKKTVSDKEQELKNLISSAKAKLKALQGKRKDEIGRLACKCGLSNFDEKTLKPHFIKLAKDLLKNNNDSD